MNATGQRSQLSSRNNGDQLTNQESNLSEEQHPFQVEIDLKAPLSMAIKEAIQFYGLPAESLEVHLSLEDDFIVMATITPRGSNSNPL